MDENQRIKESIKNLSFTQKMEHIWFYYKWFILFGAAVIIFSLVCLVQCSVRKDPDAVLMYAGPQVMSSNYYKYIDSSLSDIMSEDYNGDGHKAADLLEITLATEEPENNTQIAMQALQHQETNSQRFYIERTTGPSVIYLIDKKIYPSMKEHLAPLESVLGYIPDGAYDEYGIELKTLDAYKHTGLKYLPDNAILCIRVQREFSMLKGNDSDEYYAANVAFFKDIAEWKKPEEQQGE